ncbi:helix-turn-helix transcriptional regulator [Paenibacillus sp. 32352]|uniref:helix-turn-helix transcriptional regulator n=1 Tax=Paenibacillus sp. 32352 TaxID=1969111 RepID=UPI001C4E2E43|nr:helix-turn-helix transcriptional regulator [Paenibacillus sp. 32352]
MKNMMLISLRKNLGLTQKEAAIKIGISTSSLAMLEIGERSGRDLVKKKIADFYNKTVDEIFFAKHTHESCSKIS